MGMRGGSMFMSVLRCLGYPGPPHRGASWRAQPDSLSSCLASSCVKQLAVCWFEMDVFEMDALVTKNLMSGTYIIINKAQWQTVKLPRINMRNQVATKMQTWAYVSLKLYCLTCLILLFESARIFLLQCCFLSPYLPESLNVAIIYSGIGAPLSSKYASNGLKEET